MRKRSTEPGPKGSGHVASTMLQQAWIHRTLPGLILALLLPAPGRLYAADQTQAARGREVYQKWCTPCHGAGLGKPGTAAAAAHGIKPAVLEQRANLTPKMIETAVRKGIDIMPRFRKTEVSNADLAAIEAYLLHR